MNGIIYYTCFIFLYIVLKVYATQFGILEYENFNSLTNVLKPGDVIQQSFEGKYIYLNFKDSFELYKINTINITIFNTINFEYNIEVLFLWYFNFI